MIGKKNTQLTKLTTGIRKGCHLNATNFKGILPDIMYISQFHALERDQILLNSILFLWVNSILKVRVIEGHRVYVAVMTNRKPDPVSKVI